MLRLLNKFKRNLLKEGKVKNFLFYTLGEILLVVIGILIAIQLDRWNEERKLDQKREYYTISLLSDLRKDSASINTHIKKLDDIQNSFDLLRQKLSVFDTPSRAFMDTAYMNFISGLTTFPGFNNNTFEILRSTGDLELFPRETQVLILDVNKMQQTFLTSHTTNNNTYFITATQYWKLVLAGRDKFPVQVPNQILQKVWSTVSPEEFTSIFNATATQLGHAYRVQKSYLVATDSLTNNLIEVLNK